MYNFQSRSYPYRDRAAERRALHGSFGIAPGQKNSVVRDNDSSPVSVSTKEAAAEALNISFGAGSYARKILKNMGWKEVNPIDLLEISRNYVYVRTKISNPFISKFKMSLYQLKDCLFKILGALNQE